MANFPDHLRAIPGREITAAWHGLERWVDGYSVTVGGPYIRAKVFPEEILLYTRAEQRAWRHPFKVSVFETVAAVAPGFLNVEMPRMGPDNLTLDGLDTNGDEAEDLPTLDLLGKKDGGPGEDGRSFICLRVVVDLETGEPDKEKLPLEFLTVVHRPELPPGFHAGGMPEVIEDGASVGYWPLAVLHWLPEGKTIRQSIQYCIHNHQHRYQPGGEDGEKPGRHWFFGAD